VIHRHHGAHAMSVAGSQFRTIGKDIAGFDAEHLPPFAGAEV